MNFTAINAKIEGLRELLALEKEADFERFRREIQQLSVAEKVEKGLCWSPVILKKEGFAIGERAFVIVERTGQLDLPHRFKAGTPVDLYARPTDQKGNRDKRRQSGVIQFLEKHRMKIVFNTNDLPEWLQEGGLAVDLLFDERTYLEMDKALRTLLQANEGRLSELKAIFYGTMPAQEGKVPPVFDALLNDAQKLAVGNILAARDVAIVHGPPGTGKTTTLVSAIRELCARESSVLVTAPSNAAVDLLSERLSDTGLNVVRLGNISRVDEKLISLTLEGRLAAHPQSKNIKKVRIEAARARRDAKRFKRRFGAVEREARRDAFREARELREWARQLEERLLTEILFTADVVTCTLVNATSRVLDTIKFRTVVIDEAAQALEPATWIPITKAQKVVLAGDPFQLPPTVKSIEAQRQGLEITLLEKAIQGPLRANFLNVQYRMNAAIMGFSNQRFYEGQLAAAEWVAHWELPYPDNVPVIFIDTAGCGFEEERNPETRSSFNKGEHFILREHFFQLLKDFPEDQWPYTSVAIISPYRAQCQYVADALAEEEDWERLRSRVSINTIDAFQGQERDLIYISLVRSNAKGEIGFLRDYRRMNVAMTRARKQLIVIGDSATVGGDEFYQSFLQYVEQHGAYRSAWEYLG
ncbi:MAG: AAA domain-containing protein [Bacteroidota bacterium]